jgi:hypothetical protein
MDRNQEIGGVLVAELVLFRSMDHLAWEPVHTKDVPTKIKEPDCIARMLDGFTARIEGDAYEWRAAKVEDLKKEGVMS